MPSIPMPDPVLDDGAVRLRPWELHDVDVRIEAGHDSEILQYTSVPERPTLAEAKSWIRASHVALDEGQAAAFAVESVAAGSVAGSMGLIRVDWEQRRAEVGYWLLRAHRGAGLAGRSLELLSRWAFNALNMERLELVTNLDNLASQQVAKRGRYQFEGTLRSYSYGRYGRETLHLYSRLPAD